MFLAVLRRRATFSSVAAVICVLTVWIALLLNSQKALDRLQVFAEHKLTEALDAEVYIAAIDTALFGPTVLKGLKVVKQRENGVPIVFKTDRVIIERSIVMIGLLALLKRQWIEKNLAFRIVNGSLYKGKLRIFADVSGKGRIDSGNLIFDDLNGTAYNFPLKVYGNFSKDRRLDLEIAGRGKKNAAGLLGLHKKNGTGNNVKTERIHMTADFTRPGSVEATITLHHVSAGDIDINSQIDMELDFNEKKDGSGDIVEGRIKSSGTILDAKPFVELDGNFIIDEDILIVRYLKFGDSFIFKGKYRFSDPGFLDLLLEINNGNLGDLFLISERDPEGPAIGKLNGKIAVSGPLGNLRTVASIDADKGRLGDLDYESMNVNLYGTGPVLTLNDSRITRQEGHIKLEGQIDARNILSDKPCEGLKFVCGEDVLLWKGWDVAKTLQSNELELGRDIGDDNQFRVTFKGYLNDEESWEESHFKQKEEVGIEYKIDTDKKVKMRIKENEEIISLERKVKF